MKLQSFDALVVAANRAFAAMQGDQLLFTLTSALSYCIYATFSAAVAVTRI